MIVLDCDPGLDDAIAILLLLASREQDIAAITTVAGNVELSRTQWNARAIVDLSPRKAKVYAGCPRPMVFDHVHAKHIHGETGIPDTHFDTVECPLEREHAVDHLARLLEGAEERSVTLCFVGPLTNLGVLLVMRPELAIKVRRLVMMGGAIALGNTTPAAEYNIFADPHAAKVVFEADFPRVMLPLDTTSAVLVDEEISGRIEAHGNPASRFAGRLMRRPVSSPRFKGKGRPMHDMCAVGYCLWPDLFKGRECEVRIDCSEGMSRGRTVIDYWGIRGNANALVIDEVEAETFLSRVVERFAALAFDERRETA